MTYSLPQSWLDAMLEAVCLVDETSLHILAANHAVAELVGKPVHELVNTPVQGLAATPQDFVFWSQPVQALAEGIHSETSVLHASGALVPVERSVRGVTLPNGGGALLLTMIDLTAQRSTERELETLLSELRATLDSAADGMLVCAMDGSIRAFNQRLVNSMFTLATLVGLSVTQMTQGTTVGNLGFSDIAFPKPMFHGDTLYAETTVIDKRESKSRPGEGIVTFVHTGRNQHGDIVATATRKAMMRKKPMEDTN